MAGKRSRIDGGKRSKRDRRGRFRPGGPGGPGRRPVAQESIFLDTLRSVCSLQDWKAICKRAVEGAKRGERYCREWLSKYLLPDLEFPLAELRRLEQPPSEDALTALGGEVYVVVRKRSEEGDYIPLDRNDEDAD